MTPGDALSIVMPAKNEAVNLQKLLPLLQATLPGAELIVMSTIPARVQDLPRGEEIFVICESGGRSFQVATWLESQGFEAVNIAGGTGDWRSLGKPLDF